MFSGICCNFEHSNPSIEGRRDTNALVSVLIGMAAIGSQLGQ